LERTGYPPDFWDKASFWKVEIMTGNRAPNQECFLDRHVAALKRSA